MTRRLPIINNWGICLDPRDRYRAPELGMRYNLTGLASGRKDGDGPITTGTIRKFSRGVVSTSRNRYRLGTVDPEFVRMLTDRGMSPDPLHQVRIAVKCAKQMEVVT